jgi:hypothetical protein
LHRLSAALHQQRFFFQNPAFNGALLRQPLFFHQNDMQLYFLLSIFFWFCSAITVFPQTADTASCTKTTQALDQATTLIAAFAKAQQRDSVKIDSLVSITRQAHDDALSCKAHLTAMMMLAVSESARKLLAADNVLMFRMAVRDTRLFLDEAKRYWEHRQ